LRIIIKGQWIEDQIAQGVINYYTKVNNELVGRYEGGIRNLLREGEGKYMVGNV
jgi:hypothetical protein